MAPAIVYSKVVLTQPAIQPKGELITRDPVPFTQAVACQDNDQLIVRAGHIYLVSLGLSRQRAPLSGFAQPSELSPRHHHHHHEPHTIHGQQREACRLPR